MLFVLLTLSVRKKATFLELLISFFLSVEASVVAYYICKWLDRKKKKPKQKKTPPGGGWWGGFRFAQWTIYIILPMIIATHIFAHFKYMPKNYYYS